MYDKTIEVTTKPDLLNLLGYLKNQSHPHHGPKGYWMGEMASAHPDLTPENFADVAEQMAAEINGTKRTGAPLKNIATLHILRTPYDTYLTRRERRYVLLRYLRDVAPDGLAVYIEHINPLHGSDDINILTLCSTSLTAPRTRRKQNTRPWVEGRRFADRITDRLNARRHALGLPHIDTMPEIQRAAGKKRRGVELEEQLAALPVQVTLQNLRQQLEALGHDVRRFNPDKNYFSVRLKGAKPLDEIADEKRRKKSERGTRFDLVQLLTNVWQLRAEKRATKVARAQDKLAAFQTPKDAQTLRIVERPKRPQTPPPPEPPASPDRSR